MAEAGQGKGGERRSGRHGRRVWESLKRKIYVTHRIGMSLKSATHGWQLDSLDRGPSAYYAVHGGRDGTGKSAWETSIAKLSCTECGVPCTELTHHHPPCMGACEEREWKGGVRFKSG